MTTVTRRAFVSACGAATAAWALPDERPKAKFKLGIGTYTFRSLDIDTLALRCRELGVPNIELSHPPYMLPQVRIETIPELKRKLKAGKVNFASWYSGHLRTKADIEYLGRLVEAIGVKQVSGSAERELLPDIDRLATSQGFGFGTHNHYFKGRKFLYESPDDLLSAVRGRSPNMYITFDAGHMWSCGFEPSEAYLKVKQHIRVVHLKDEHEPGRNAILGKGKVDMAKFLRTIVRDGFSGLAAIEYEEGDDPKQEVAECVKFVHEQVRL